MTAGRLAERGIRTARDLLLCLPKGYDDLRQVTPIGGLPAVAPGTAVLVRGIVQRLAEASGDRAWNIAEDPIISRGGCRVSSENSTIDAQVEQRIGAAIAAAMGDARSAATEEAS